MCGWMVCPKELWTYLYARTENGWRWIWNNSIRSSNSITIKTTMHSIPTTLYHCKHYDCILLCVCVFCSFSLQFYFTWFRLFVYLLARFLVFMNVHGKMNGKKSDENHKILYIQVDRAWVYIMYNVASKRGYNYELHRTNHRVTRSNRIIWSKDA